MSELPTREEIATILDVVCEHYGWDPPADLLNKAADALLARLRPAWERLLEERNAAREALRQAFENGERFLEERDALRADLRALAGNVVRLLLHVRDHGCSGCVEDIDAMIERVAPQALESITESVKALIAAKRVTRALLDKEITI